MSGGEEARHTRRVLLLSPVRSLDPANGDVTYTEQLLGNPPDGYEYLSYDAALATGVLKEVRLSRTQFWARLRACGLRAPAAIINAASNLLRRHGVLFREPFRLFDVKPGAFDLIHVHVFSTSLRPRGLPIVLSNSIEIDAVYRDGRGLAASRVAWMRWADIFLSRLLRVAHSSYGQRGARAVIVFSEYLQHRFESAGQEAKRLHLVPPFVPETSMIARSCASHDGHLEVGFIGDWTAKGGDTVLQAVARLRSEGHPVSLTVVGAERPSHNGETAVPWVRWLGRLPREQLLSEVVPAFGVFAYPSRFDGLPLTLLEVMSCGIPVIVSDYRALPEVVGDGEGGLVVPVDDVSALTSALRELLDPAARRRIGMAGQKRVQQRYGQKLQVANLGRVYDLAFASDGTGA